MEEDGGRRYKAVGCRSSDDPMEKNSSNNALTVNSKLPMCEGPEQAKNYVHKAFWPNILRIVSEELWKWENKELNTYQTRLQLGEGLRLRMNLEAEEEDKFTVLVIGRGNGVGPWSLGPFIIVKVSDKFYFLMSMLLTTVC